MARLAERHKGLKVQQEYFAAFREAFIDTLIKTKADDYAVDAWRATLNACIDYMVTPPKQVEGSRLR